MGARTTPLEPGGQFPSRTPATAKKRSRDIYSPHQSERERIGLRINLTLPTHPNCSTRCIGHGDKISRSARRTAVLDWPNRPGPFAQAPILQHSGRIGNETNAQRVQGATVPARSTLRADCRRRLVPSVRALLLPLRGDAVVCGGRSGPQVANASRPARGMGRLQRSIHKSSAVRAWRVGGSCKRRPFRQGRRRFGCVQEPRYEMVVEVRAQVAVYIHDCRPEHSLPVC